MKPGRFINGIAGFFEVMDSAIAVSAAFRNHRRADRGDLKRLGIDPDRFSDIQRY